MGRSSWGILSACDFYDLHGEGGFCRANQIGSNENPYFDNYGVKYLKSDSRSLEAMQSYGNFLTFWI